MCKVEYNNRQLNVLNLFNLMPKCDGVVFLATKKHVKDASQSRWRSFTKINKKRACHWVSASFVPTFYWGFNNVLGFLPNIIIIFFFQLLLVSFFTCIFCVVCLMSILYFFPFITCVSLFFVYIGIW